MNQIICIIRFSYPSLGGFKTDWADQSAAEAFLYEPDRLALRFYLFEALCAPSLAKQTDTNFTPVIVIGDGFPAEARAHLEAIVAPIANVRIVALPSMPHFPAMRTVIEQVTDPTADFVTTCRIDDDDAVDHGYIARLRATCDAMRTITPERTPVAIAFNRGFYLHVGNGEGEIYDVVERTPLGLGAALMGPRGMRENIFRRNHRLLPQFYNTYSDAKTPTFIRTIHRANDADPHLTGRKNVMKPEAIVSVLSENFSFDYDALQRL